MINPGEVQTFIGNVGLLDLVAALILVVAGLFLLTAALGTFWLKDSLQRMAAISKGAIGGAIVIALVTGMLDFRVTTWWQVIIVIAFLILTMPIASQLIGRAAYRRPQEIDNATCFSPDADPQTWQNSIIS